MWLWRIIYTNKGKDVIDTWSDYIEIENHLDEMTEIQECIDYYDRKLLELNLKYKQDEEILLRLLKQKREELERYNAS